MTSSVKSGLTDSVFFEGDPVVLARGPNTGTVGVFLWSRADIKWVGITERNGAVRSHPLEWLAHVAIVRQVHRGPGATRRAFFTTREV